MMLRKPWWETPPRSLAGRTGIGYCNSIAQSIDAYRACGDPNALEFPQLRLTGYSDGANKLQAVASIRRHSRLSLAEAKDVIDDCLRSNEAIATTDDVASAKQLLAALADVGFFGTVPYDQAASLRTNDR